MNEFIYDLVNLFVLLLFFLFFLKKVILIMYKEIDKIKWIIEWKIFLKKMKMMKSWICLIYRYELK